MAGREKDPTVRAYVARARKRKKRQSATTPVPAYLHPTVKPAYQPEEKPVRGRPLEPQPPKEQPIKWDEAQYGEPIKPTIPGLIHTSATDAANLGPMKQAFFDKWHCFPTAKQAKALLEAANGVWTRQEWADLLKPMKSVIGIPAVKQYAQYTNSKYAPAGPATIGIGEEIREFGPGLYGFDVTEDIITNPVTVGGKFYAVTGKDSPLGLAATPDPDFKEIPDTLRVLDKAARDIGRMTPGERAYLDSISGGIIGWKKFMAETLRKNGDPVPFNPNTSEWSRDLDSLFHQYVFGRLLPYALIHQDEMVRAQALGVMAELYPKIVGEKIKDPTKMSKDILTNGIANLQKVFIDAGMSDSGIINTAYNGFIDGRIPGQSVKKAMYDYVDEFGVDALPADAYKEYQDDLFTMERAVGEAFMLPMRAGEQWERGTGWLAEKTDFLLDAWKDVPGASGYVGEIVHDVYNFSVKHVNPVSAVYYGMEGIGYGISYGMLAGATVIDILADLSIDRDMQSETRKAYNDYVETKQAIINSDKSEEEKRADIEVIDREWRESAGIAPEPGIFGTNPGLFGPVTAESWDAIGLSDLLKLKTWTERFKQQQDAGPGTAIARVYYDYLGVDEDSAPGKALYMIGEVGNLWLALKAGKYMDKGLRWSAPKLAKAGWKGTRKIEDALGGGPIDLGADPTNPRAAQPARYRDPKTGRFVTRAVAEEQGWEPPETKEPTGKTPEPDLGGPQQTPRARPKGRGSNKPPQRPSPFTGEDPTTRHRRVPFDRGENEFSFREEGPLERPVRRTVYRGGPGGGMLYPEPPTWTTADKSYAEIYAADSHGQSPGVSRYYIDPGAKVLERTADEFWGADLQDKAQAALEAGIDVVHVTDKNEYIILNEDVVHPKSFGAKVGKGESEAVPPDYADVIIRKNFELEQIRSDIRSGKTPGTPEALAKIYRLEREIAEAKRLGKDVGKPATEEGVIDVERPMVVDPETGVLYDSKLERGTLTWREVPEPESIIPKTPEPEAGNIAYLNAEEGAPQIGKVPERLPYSREWGATDADLRAFFEFTRLPENTTITPEMMRPILERLGISPAAQRMLLAEMGDGLQNLDIGGFLEMVRRNNNRAAYDARHRGRTLGAEANNDIGAMIAYLRGVRRTIFNEIESGRGTPAKEQRLMQVDAQLQTLMRTKGGGLPAMIGRILEIDAEMVPLRLRWRILFESLNERLKKGGEISPAERAELGGLRDRTNKLLDERRELINSGTEVESVETLGGEFVAYRTESGTTRLAQIEAELARIDEARKAGVDVTEDIAELMNERFELRKRLIDEAMVRGDIDGAVDALRGRGGVGAGYQPYGPTDFNRAPKRPSGMGEAEPTAHEYSRGPRGRMVRSDYQAAKRPAAVDDPLTIDEWNSLLDGKTVRGKTLADIIDGKDAVVLEAGTIILDLKNPRVRAAAEKSKKGEPVERSKPSVKPAEKAPEEPTEEAPPGGKPPEPPKGVPGGEKPRKRGPNQPSEREMATRSWFTRNVAEWIAQMTQSGDDSYSAIAGILGLRDNPKVNNPIIARLQNANTWQEVVAIVDPLVKDGTIEVDLMGPAFWRQAKTQTVERMIDLADKAGPISRPLVQAIRLYGVRSPLDNTIDEIGSPSAIRGIGLASKLGNKRMTPEVRKRITYWQNKMARATTGGARRRIARQFEDEIKRNMGYVEKGGVDKTPATAEWSKYLKMRNRILNARAKSFLRAAKGPERGKYTDPHTRAYSLHDRVPPTHKELALARKNLEALRDEAVRNGDDVAAERYNRMLAEANEKFDEYTAASEEFVRLVNKDKKTPEEQEAFDHAAAVLDGMGHSEPVWVHQLTHRIEFQINHRILAWYQSGRNWRNFSKFDTKYMEKPVRLWKQWAMFGLGFPIRVFAGDELWRIPMEGISLERAAEGLAAARMLEGKLPHRAQKRFETLRREKNKRKLSDEEQKELDALTRQQEPMGGEYERKFLEDLRDMDMAGDPSDSFDIAAPVTTRYLRGDGTYEFVTTLPNEPLYIPAVKHIIEKLGTDPVIRSLLDADPPEGGWTMQSTVNALMVQLLRRDETGAALRQFLVDTNRATPAQLKPSALRKALSHPSGGTYRNVQNIVNEWAEVWLKVSRDETLLNGIKNHYITIEELYNVPPENLFPAPIVRTISGDLWADVPFLNIPSKIYNGFRVPGLEFDIGTLPMMAWMGSKVRNILFGAKFNEVLAEKGIRLADYADNPAEFKRLYAEESRRAAQIAADFTERTTFTRNATIFEDMMRNAIPFINSYRQFMVYWGTKMITRPATMAAIWEYAPQIPISTQAGVLQMFLSGLQPFFLQPNDDEERRAGLQNMAKNIFTPPSLNPAGTAVLGWALREMTSTRGDIDWVPGLGGTSFVPGGKMGMWIEGLVGLPEPLKGTVFQDDTPTQAAWNSIIGRYTETPTGSLGAEKLEVQMPEPLNWLDKLPVHNVNALWQAATGTFAPASSRFQDPVTAKYDEERVRYAELERTGRPGEAAEYLSNSEYLHLVLSARQTSDPEELLRIKLEHPEIVRLLAGRYDWDTDGSFIWSPEWTKTALSREDYEANIRRQWYTVYGGHPMNDDGYPIMDIVYVGDINRKPGMKTIKEHLKEIREYAKTVARDIAKDDKKFYKALMDEWDRKTDEDIAVDKFNSVPNMPTWYKAALKRDGKPVREWHPKYYTEDSLGFYHTSAEGIPFTPSKETQQTILEFNAEGLLGEQAKAELLGRWSKWGPNAMKREKELVDEWQQHLIDLDEEAWYDADSEILQRVGFDIPDPEKMDATILRVRAAYYKMEAVKEKYGFNSDQARAARNWFYAYKDREFLKVKGGEIFVGGLPRRLLNAPFIAGCSFKFTGDDAEDNQKLWSEFRKEAYKDKPDLAKIKELKSHFNVQLDKKLAAWNAQAQWYAVIGAAQYAREVMKSSYSEYYEGPGNSRYSTMGEKMVDNLEFMIKSYMKDEPDKKNEFKREVVKYFGDPHSLAGKLLEWYFH